MEYCSGGELFDILEQYSKEDKVFDEIQASIVFQKLLSAINHLHVNQIAHRDIKPENVMISDQGEIKLIDFGLSKSK